MIRLRGARWLYGLRQPDGVLPAARVPKKIIPPCIHDSPRRRFIIGHRFSPLLKNPGNEQ